jgi:hypothetical protein
MQHKVLLHFCASKFEGQDRWLPPSPSAKLTGMPVRRPYSLAQTASTGAVVIIAVVVGLVVFMRKRGG